MDRLIEDIYNKLPENDEIPSKVKELFNDDNVALIWNYCTHYGLVSDGEEAIELTESIMASKQKEQNSACSKYIYIAGIYNDYKELLLYLTSDYLNCLPPTSLICAYRWEKWNMFEFISSLENVRLNHNFLYEACDLEDEDMLEYAMKHVEYDDYAIIKVISSKLEKVNKITSLTVKLLAYISNIEKALPHISCMISSHNIEVVKGFEDLYPNLIQLQNMKDALLTCNIEVIEHYLKNGTKVDEDAMGELFAANKEFNKMIAILNLMIRYNVDLSQVKMNKNPQFDEELSSLLNSCLDTKKILRTLYVKIPFGYR